VRLLAIAEEEEEDDDDDLAVLLVPSMFVLTSVSWPLASSTSALRNVNSTVKNNIIALQTRRLLLPGFMADLSLVMIC
jgi:hypothetical protein